MTFLFSFKSVSCRWSAPRHFVHNLTHLILALDRSKLYRRLFLYPRQEPLWCDGAAAEAWSKGKQFHKNVFSLEWLAFIACTRRRKLKLKQIHFSEIIPYLDAGVKKNLQFKSHSNSGGTFTRIFFASDSEINILHVKWIFFQILISTFFIYSY